MLESRFFYRSPQKEEVDIVYIKEDQVIPVEVKIKSSIKKHDLRGILAFLKRFNLRKGLLITADQEGLWKEGKQRIQMIPYWRYWSIKRYLKYG